MNRRQFLTQLGVAGGLSLLSSKLWALPSGSQAAGSRLLVVLLRGGYDGNSLLIPYGSPYYYAARPNIAIPKPDSNNAMSVLDIGQGYGLHPAVGNTIYPMYQQRQAMFIPFSGSQDLSRSHFEAQDLMELGQSSEMQLDYNSGFLNRLVSVLQHGHPQLGGMSFTGNLPLSFKGNMQIPNISLRGEVRDAADDHQSQLLKQLYPAGKLKNYMQEGFQTRHEVSAELAKEMQAASRGATKAIGFDKEARSIATLMRDNPAYAVGFIDVGGWDSHVNQGAATGQLANNLENLAKGLSGYADELGKEAWKQTTVVVMSEFGRTFHENGTLGTDHGHGNTLWVLGGSISGGKLAGELDEVTETNLFQNRDSKILNDYRSILANIMQKFNSNK
jgi:uncharacterized protein (DUF1501 family)